GTSLDPDFRTLNRATAASEEHFDTVTLDNSVLGKFNTGPLAHELLIGIAIVNQITQLRYPFETSPLRQVPLLGLGQTQRIYPVFQFAPNTGPEPRPEVLEVNRRLDIGQDPLGAASWWLSPNSWLNAPPAALLGTARADEINYAAEQLDSDSW
ncbi:MAG: hypothetical protein J0H43_02735, partial [Actinobacteria bacterium]|nr:hypothetical protein [Actinomycetota bacterium]